MEDFIPYWSFAVSEAVLYSFFKWTGVFLGLPISIGLVAALKGWMNRHRRVSAKELADHLGLHKDGEFYE
jgi:hypothetical protein